MRYFSFIRLMTEQKTKHSNKIEFAQRRAKKSTLGYLVGSCSSNGVQVVFWLLVQ
jgi:hypothetical protein